MVGYLPHQPLITFLQLIKRGAFVIILKKTEYEQLVL